MLIGNPTYTSSVVTAESGMTCSKILNAECVVK